MSVNVEVRFDERALDELAHLPAVHEELMRQGDRVAGRAAAVAPRRTGALARSIRAVPHGDEVHITWHVAYGRYQEFGTHTVTAKRFLERGLFG